MVRIPRGSGCLCAPLYTVPATPNDSDESTPAAPPVASPAPGKVQKSARRQSHIQAAPENIAKALEAMPDDLKLEDRAPKYLAGLPQHQHVRNENQSPNLNDKPSPPSVAPNSERSCCGGQSSASVAPNPVTPQQSSQNQRPVLDETGLPYVGYPWQNLMHSTQPPLMQPFGMQNTPIPQPYVEDYSSNTPSAPYVHSMDRLHISESPMSPFAAQIPYASAPAATPGDCLDCECGDDCQCLGCITHPFNKTTRRHVQEMSAMMSFDRDEQFTESVTEPWRRHPLHGNSMTHEQFMRQPPIDPRTHQTLNQYDYFDLNSAVPSGYASPLPGNNQLMNTSDYITLEYPVGIPSACSDVTGSCQCGNDCACFGCATHSGHNGIPLNAPLPVSSSVNTTGSQTPSQTMAVTTPDGSQSSRFSVLENVSAPCLSHRQFHTH
ncbi:uncharacterized protein N7484_002216 [Penicillium longicatenatum]|uniref:uncharacterized protein n=1 Tax=Penicillium longicatenatum TaxID=1561947 RepID=UPI0025494A06|nr:uncharacterized protein N7484_002216 [Penicillium longicatenatum]KAJ5658567.1 hypothetical protein N7484_002216 [Penicillium longicatenatum]